VNKSVFLINQLDNSVGKIKLSVAEFTRAVLSTIMSWLSTLTTAANNRELFHLFRLTSKDRESTETETRYKVRKLPAQIRMGATSLQVTGKPLCGTVIAGKRTLAALATIALSARRKSDKARSD
jgi:hypothetical protein